MEIFYSSETQDYIKNNVQSNSAKFIVMFLILFIF